VSQTRFGPALHDSPAAVNSAEIAVPTASVAEGSGTAAGLSGGSPLRGCWPKDYYPEGSAGIGGVQKP